MNVLNKKIMIDRMLDDMRLGYNYMTGRLLQIKSGLPLLFVLLYSLLFFTLILLLLGLLLKWQVQGTKSCIIGQLYLK